MAARIVCDASVSAKWILQEEYSEQARGLLSDCIATETRITVPPLWSYALDSIIRFRRFRGELSESQADEAFGFIDGMPITVRYLALSQSRAREIAAQANQRRVYDSIYAAHAEIEDCILWTADYEYFRAIRGFLSHVRYLGDL